MTSDKTSKGIRRRKSSPNTGIFRKATDRKGLKTYKLRSPRNEYSADKQMLQLKEDIKAHGIKETEDDNGDKK